MMFCACVGVVSLLYGCQGTEYRQRESILGQNWGKAFEAAKHNQILNPDAPDNLDPVVGLDGHASERNMEVYRKSFEKPAPEPNYNINWTNMGGRQ